MVRYSFTQSIKCWHECWEMEPVLSLQWGAGERSINWDDFLRESDS